MGEREECIVREFIKEWECQGSWDDAQIDRILSRMAPDARFHVYAWEAPVTGHDAIRAEFQRQASLFRNLRSEIKAIASTDHTIFIERVDTMMVGKKPLTQHVAAVAEVDDAGNIDGWRDYYDSKEVEAQLGAGTSTAGSRA